MKMLLFLLMLTEMEAMENGSALAERREVPQLSITVVDNERINNCCVNIKSTCDKDELKFKAKMTLLFLTSAGIIATTTGLIVHFLDKCN